MHDNPSVQNDALLFRRGGPVAGRSYRTGGRVGNPP